MNKYIISYIEKVPLWRTILGVANIVFTIFNLVTSGNIATIVPLAFSYLLLKTEGTEIDLESKTYRKVFSILGFKIGKWQPIPDIDYVSVFAATFKTTVWASSASVFGDPLELPVDENHEKNPISNYGISKLKGVNPPLCIPSFFPFRYTCAS